jgi:hypothetical protein
MNYPEPHAIPSIPYEWLGEAIRRFRRLIEDGLILTCDVVLDVERRVDDLVDPDPQAHHFGLSKTLLVFCDWMRRWAASDCAAARAEVIRWQASGERYLDLTAGDLPKRHPWRCWVFCGRCCQRIPETGLMAPSR